MCVYRGTTKHGVLVDFMHFSDFYCSNRFCIVRGLAGLHRLCVHMFLLYQAKKMSLEEHKHLHKYVLTGLPGLFKQGHTGWCLHKKSRFTYFLLIWTPMEVFIFFHQQTRGFFTIAFSMPKAKRCTNWFYFRAALLHWPLFSIGLIVLSTLCTCACTITQYILHSNTYEQTEISSKGVSSFTRRKITKSFQSIYSISAGNEDWQAWRQLLLSSHCWKNKNSEVWAGKVGRHSQREPDSVEPAALKGPCSVQNHQLNRKLPLSCRVEQTWLQKCKKWKN